MEDAMKSATHVQLGKGLETGATHAGIPAPAFVPAQETHLELDFDPVDDHHGCGNFCGPLG